MPRPRKNQAPLPPEDKVQESAPPDIDQIDACSQGFTSPPCMLQDFADLLIAEAKAKPITEAPNEESP